MDDGGDEPIADETHGAAQADSTSGEKVDHIREILFGGQMRDYEQRFESLDERLQVEAARLRRDLETRITRLEAHAAAEIQNLSERLQCERKERMGAESDSTDALGALAKESRSALSDLEHRLSTELQAVRAALHQLGTDFGESLRQSHDGLEHGFQRHVRNLQDDKISHAALSDMFAELAMRLRGDFSLPDRSDGA